MRSSGVSLEKCVETLRKTERDMIAKRADRRKLKILARKLTKRRIEESDASDCEQERRPTKRSRRVLKPGRSGTIGLPPPD